MPESRKLATIMSVDVAGYSRIAEADDSAAAAAVERLKDALSRIATAHGGRIFNTAGDGVMLEFPVASAGVQAALALLVESKAGERPLPRVRVGLHLGEVIVADNGDLLGHGVNVAARLQALAAPGTAIVSQAVQSQVRRAASVDFVPQGRVHLDKMAETMDVFALAAPGESPKTSLKIWLSRSRRALAVAVAAGLVMFIGLLFLLPWQSASQVAVTATPPNAAPRLAVLRLERLGDVEPYFADGLAEELINEAATINGLETIGRTSSFALKGEDATPAGAARLLSATIVLEGSVRRVGDRLHVAARLLDAPGARELWGESFDGDLSSVFSLQRRIAARIAQALNLRLGQKQPPNVDPRAYELYLRGTLAAYTTDRTVQATANALFTEATRRDPNFALAWSALAKDLIWPNYFRGEGVPAAEVAAERALALDPTLPEPYSVKADIALYRGRWQEAAQMDERARALGAEPGFVLSTLGRMREAVEAAQNRARLDPLNPDAYDNLLQQQWFAGDYDAALATARRRRELMGLKPSGSGYVLEILLDAKRYDEARKYIKEMTKEEYANVLTLTQMTDGDIRWRLGEGPKPDLKPIIDAGLQNDGYRIWAASTLVAYGATKEATMLLDGLTSHNMPGSDLFTASNAAMRKLPAFWRAMERIGLTRYWRESRKWPDCCASEKTCPK